MYDFKISEGNSDRKHRDQLIRDMLYVCSISDLSKRTRKEFLDKCISWPFSDYAEDDIEKHVKLTGCNYWSQEALDIYNDFRKKKAEKLNPKSLESQLTHEHVVPRNVFKKAMEEYFSDLRNDMSNIKYTDIENLFNHRFKELKDMMDNRIFGCVVTKDEAIIIDGKTPGLKKEGPYKKNMPNTAYPDNIAPESDLDKFRKIIHPWARYQLVENVITIHKLQWYGTDYEIIDENILKKI